MRKIRYKSYSGRSKEFYDNAVKKLWKIEVEACACKIPTVIGIIGYMHGVKLTKIPVENAIKSM